MTKQENRLFIILSTTLFALYYGIIQLYLVTSEYISATDLLASNVHVYDITRIKAGVSLYSKIIPINIILIVLLVIFGYVLTEKLKATDYYKSQQKASTYIKKMITENGGYIGIILITIIMVDYNLPDYGERPNFYLRLKMHDIPHILFVLPVLSAPLLLWISLDLTRKRIIDYIASVVLVIWVLLIAIFTFFIIIFYDTNNFHMT